MFELPDQFHRDREELDDLQREIVNKMRERLKDDDLSNSDLCKFADKCADFQKLANDREKTAIARERIMAYERRTSAHYHIAHGRNETQLELARQRAEAAKARSRPNHPQMDEDDEDPTAPYGRKKDGTPYTQEEFRDSLNEAIREIYGLPPIDPNNKMPDGWNGDDESTIRARSASDGSDPADGPPVHKSSEYEEPPTRLASSRHSPESPHREEPLDLACRLADRPSPTAPTPHEPPPSHDPFAIRSSPFAISPSPGRSPTPSYSDDG